MEEVEDGPPKLYCSSRCYIGKNNFILAEENVVEPGPLPLRRTFFNTGVVAFLKVPHKMQVGDFMSRIPIMILEREIVPDGFSYAVGIKGFTIDGWFPHEMLEEDPSNEIQLSLFGVTLAEMDSQDTINCWGFDRRKKKYRFVYLEEAYSMFVESGGNYNGRFQKIIYKDSS